MAFDLASAKPVTGGFDLSTAKPVSEDAPIRSWKGVATDTGRTFMSGVHSGVGDAIGEAIQFIGDKTGSAALQDVGETTRLANQEKAKEYQGSMSPEGKAMLNAPLFDGIKPVGNGAGNWLSSAALQAIQSLPGMIVTAPVGGVAARGIAKVGGAVLPEVAAALVKGGAGLEGGASAIGNESLRSAIASQGAGRALADRALSLAPTAIGYGGAEGVLAGAQNAAQTRSEIEQAPFDVLHKSSPVFRQYVEESGGDQVAARLRLAKDASEKVLIDTAISTGGIGALTGGGAMGMVDRAAQNVTKDRLVKSVSKGIYKGAGEEALQEFPQSGMEAYIQNKASQEYVDPTIDPLKGTLSQAMQGGVVGGLSGAAFGGAGKLNNYHAETPAAHEAEQSAPVDHNAVLDTLAKVKELADAQRAKSSTENNAEKYGFDLSTAQPVATEQTSAPDAQPIQPTQEQANASQTTKAIAPEAQQPTQGARADAVAQPQDKAPIADTSAPGETMSAIPDAQVSQSVTDTIRPDVEQLIKRRRVAGELGMTRQMDIIIGKAKEAMQAGRGDAALFNKAAKLFKDKDAQIYGVLQNISNEISPKVAPAARAPARASHDLLQRIKQLGGIDSSLALDVTGEKHAPGGWRFAFKKGGRGLDDLATSLSGEGFNIDMGSPHDNGGVNQLADMIRQHINGERNFKASTQEAAAEEAAHSRNRDAMMQHAEELGINVKGMNERAILDAIYQEEDAREMARMDAADNPEAAAEQSDAIFDGIANDSDIEFTASSPDEIAAWLGEEDHGQEGNASAVQGAIAKGQEAGTGSNSGTSRQAQGTGQEVLQSYTAAEVAQREQAARNAQQTEDHAATQRAVDHERNQPLSLTAQTQERAEGATSQGQMFTPDGRASAAAESNPQAEAITKLTETVGKLTEKVDQLVSKPDTSFSLGNSGDGKTVEEVTKATARLRNGWNGFHNIKIVQSVREVPNDIYLRALRALKPIAQATEGFYDTKTNSVYLIADNIATPERAVWVAAHEVVGHGGIRMLSRDVQETTSIAARNSTVEKLAKAIAADRREKYDAVEHIDEAIAELSAAHITGDFDSLLKRYGVDAPAGMRGRLQELIKRVVDAIRNFMAKVQRKPVDTVNAEDVSDSDILDLIRQMKGAVEGKAKAQESADAGYAMASVKPKSDEEGAGGMSGERTGTDSIQPTPAPLPNVPGKDNIPASAGQVNLPRNTDIASKLLPKSVPLLYSRDELGNIRSDLLGSRRLKDFLHAAFFRPMAIKMGMAQATPELAKLIRRQKADIDKSLRIAAQVVNDTKGMSEAESALISRIVTQEMRSDDIPPDHAMKIAAAVEQAMTQQGQDAVDLKMLSQEAYEKWKGKYLPRLYMRHLDPEIHGVWRRTFNSSPVEGFRSGSLKGRGKRQVVTVAELPQWESLGWEVADKNWKRSDLELTVDGKRVPSTDTVVIWKDYTPAERKDMGEVEDFRLRFVMGYLSMQRDLSIGRLYKQIAQNPEWTRRTPSEGFDYVPETEIPETGGLKRYGMLSGLYVKKDVLSHISQFEQNDNEFQKFYKAALSKWKEGKTVLNPVTHMNNFVSNITMAHFAGVSYWDGEKYYLGLKDLVTKAPMMQEAEDAGLFTGDFSHADIMKGMPAEVRNLVNHTTDSNAVKAGRFVWKLASLGLNEKAANAYHWGDTIFKYIIYRDARSKGMSPEDAVYHASKYIFNYDDLPSTARGIRDYAMPFFSYTYKVVPALINTAVEYPWRFAAPATMIASLNALVYAGLAADAGDDDWWLTAILNGSMNALLNAYTLGMYGDSEAKTAGQRLEQGERKNLAEWDKGASALGTQKTIRMGMDEKTGLPVFLNVYRFIPGGDMQDVNNEKGGVGGIPAPLMPSNPLLGLYSSLVDNRNWDGKELFDKNDTAKDKTKKTADFAYKQLFPAIAPGGSHYDRILNGAANYFDTTIENAHPLKDYTGTGRDGLPAQPKYAAMQTIGIKAKPVNLELSAEMNSVAEKSQAQSIKTEIRGAARLREKGAISQREYDRIEREGLDKMDALTAQQ